MILFLYGEDIYSSLQRLKEFMQVAAERNGDFNVDQVEAAGFTFKKFVGLVSAMPFLGEKRLVVLKNILSECSAEVCGEVAEYLKTFSRTDLNIIFYERGDSFDKRRILSKFLLGEEIKKYEFNRLEGVSLEEFINKELFRKEAKISLQAKKYLMEIFSGDLFALKNDLLKLVAYAYGRQIEIEDVKKIIKADIHSDIFLMIEALSKRDFKKSRQEFEKLLLTGESEFYLFTMIVYQFRTLLKVKYLDECGMGQSEIAKISKLHPFVVKKAFSAAFNFEMAELKKVYTKLLDIDLKSKSVSEFDLIRALDLFAYELCFK